MMSSGLLTFKYQRVFDVVTKKMVPLAPYEVEKDSKVKEDHTNLQRLFGG